MSTKEEDEDNDEIEGVCTCYHCTINGCIQFSEMNSPVSHVSSDGSNGSVNLNHFCRNYKIISRDDEESSDPESNTTSYIYKRPIQVISPSSHKAHEGHFMGSTLDLIITFNLAMMYHLKAVQSSCTNNKNKVKEDTTKRYTHAALKLYIHAMKCEDQLICKNYCNTRLLSLAPASSLLWPPVNNTRFNMILYSNMSQIYYLKNHKNH